MRLGDTITLLEGGRVAQTGAAMDILARPADEYVRRFTRVVNHVRVLTARDVMTSPFASNADRPVVEVASDDLLSQVAARLIGQPGAAVVERAEVIGYVSVDDVLAALAENAD